MHSFHFANPVRLPRLVKILAPPSALFNLHDWLGTKCEDLHRKHRAFAWPSTQWLRDASWQFFFDGFQPRPYPIPARLPLDKTRLLHASKRLDDPGIETPTGVAPPFDQLKAYFAGLIDRLEQDEAAAALGEVKTSGEADKQAGSKRRSTNRKK